MADPLKYYTPERKEVIRGWMKKIDCPILILQGKTAGLYETNFKIFIPKMKELGRTISHRTYPKVSHGFYWRNVKAGATLEIIEQFVEDVDKFLSL